MPWAPAIPLRAASLPGAISTFSTLRLTIAFFLYTDFHHEDGAGFCGGGVGGFSFGMMGGEPEPWQYPQQYAPPGVRFASNHFPHNSNVAIRLECWFKLYRANGGLDDGYVVATLTPKAYNKLAAWKTTVTSSGGPWPPELQARIDGIVNLGANQYRAANYEHDANHVKSKGAALAALDSSTGLFVNTHGGAPGITHTTGWD